MINYTLSFILSKEVFMQDKSVESLSVFLIKITKIYLGILCAVIAGRIYEYFTILKSSDNISSTVFLPVKIIMVLVNLGYIFFAVFVFINFLRFIYRISYNLINKYDVALKDSPELTVAYFFIPVLNLFEPYVAIKAMWNNLNESKNIKLLNYWWALRVISMLYGIAYAVYTVFSFLKSNNSLTSVANLISDSISLLLTYLLIKVIYSLSKAYNEKYGSITATDNSAS